MRVSGHGCVAGLLGRSNGQGGKSSLDKQKSCTMNLLKSYEYTRIFMACKDIHAMDGVYLFTQKKNTKRFFVIFDNFSLQNHCSFAEVMGAILKGKINSIF